MNAHKSIEKLISKTKRWMCEYDPIILYKWIFIVSIHPSNQIYLARFDFLLTILTSLNPNEFKKKEFDYESFNDYINEFKQNSDALFFYSEDYVPFSQLKLIPYFFERDKYYFFYGQSERPYELLRNLDKIFMLKLNNFTELLILKEIFIQVLNYQTLILTKLSEIEESKIELKDGIYIPSLDFYNQINNLILIKEQKILDKRFILEFGHSDKNLIENFEQIIYGKFFRNLYIKFSEKEYALILPELHIEILYDIFIKIIEESNYRDTIEISIQNNVKNVIHNELSYLFDNINEEILSKDGKKFDDFDFIILFQQNLFIIKIVDLFSKDDLDSRISESYSILDMVENDIKTEIFTEFQVNYINIYKIILFESLNIAPHSITFDFERNSQMTVFSLMDFISILQFSKSPLSFLKFLEEKYSISNLLTIDEINIFALFLQNNESIPSLGVDIQTIYPHLWSHFYDRYLYIKYQDSIYELIECEFPDKFNKIKKWRDEQHIYECFDTRTLDSANIIKLSDRLIWIINPDFIPPLKLEDIEFAMRVIGPLYSDYLQRIINPFKLLISTYTSSKKYAIFLIPQMICSQYPKYKKFEDFYTQVNEENPIIVYTFLNRQLKLISMIFYDHILWAEKFSDNKSNENALYAIKQLIYSIFKFFESKLLEEKILQKADEFIDKHFISHERDYFLESLPARNQMIKKYPLYLKLNSTDQERVIKEAENFLRKNQIPKGTRNSEESKKLLNDLYIFLYQKFEKLLSGYDITILYFAYTQLELLEGQRYLLYIEAGMRDPRIIDNGYLQYFTNRSDEISKLSITQRFIISCILKQDLSDTQQINSIDYGYIQALSLYLISISQKSEFIHSGMIEYNVIIRDFKKFDESQTEAVFNLETFKETEAKNRLESTRTFFNNVKKLSGEEKITENEIEDEIIMIEELEDSFQTQLSFSFTNMMRIIWILSSLKYSQEDLRKMFPLVLIEKKHLIHLLKEEYKKQYKNKTGIQQDTTAEEINLILNYLSLSFNSYEDQEILLRVRLIKKKERMTICPLIQVNNHILFGRESCSAAFRVWRRNIFAGVFPYELSPEDPIYVALQKIHSFQDKIFEEECGEIVERTLGEENYVMRLKNFKRISESLPRNPPCGEIDLLVVNKELKICFILDAKNYFLKLHPLDIKNELNRFILNSKSDLGKLHQKEQFIKENLVLIFDYFQIADRIGWKFKKGFIVKHNFPSAYVPDLDVDFVFQNELDIYLKS